jgi:hypothetical protein
LTTSFFPQADQTKILTKALEVALAGDPLRLGPPLTGHQLSRATVAVVHHATAGKPMSDTSTILSLGQAARLTGFGKTTLARAIKAGRLSATRNETGGYSIDAAELARVFPFPAPTEPGTATAPVVHHATAGDQVEALRGWP